MYVGVQAVGKGHLGSTASKVRCCCGIYVLSSPNPVRTTQPSFVCTTFAVLYPWHIHYNSYNSGAVGWKGKDKGGRPVGPRRAKSGQKPVFSLLEVYTSRVSLPVAYRCWLGEGTLQEVYCSRNIQCLNRLDTPRVRTGTTHSHMHEVVVEY